MVNELNQQIYTQKEIKEMKEKGLYTSSDEKSFKSDKQIKRKLALKGELPVFETQIPDKKTLNTGTIEWLLARSNTLRLFPTKRMM